jgi:hypothetical protein
VHSSATPLNPHLINNVFKHFLSFNNKPQPAVPPVVLYWCCMFGGNAEFASNRNFRLFSHKYRSKFEVSQKMVLL